MLDATHGAAAGASENVTMFYENEAWVEAA